MGNISETEAKNLDSIGDECFWCQDGILEYENVVKGERDEKVVNVYSCTNDDCYSPSYIEEYKDEEGWFN